MLGLVGLSERFTDGERGYTGEESGSKEASITYFYLKMKED